MVILVHLMDQRYPPSDNKANELVSCKFFIFHQYKLSNISISATNKKLMPMKMRKKSRNLVGPDSFQTNQEDEIKMKRSGDMLQNKIYNNMQSIDLLY